LTHNLPSNLDTDSDNSSSEGGKFGGRKGLKWNEDLDLRICLNTYQIEYKKGGSEYMYDTQMNREVHGKLERSKTHRNEKFAVGCGLNVKWMRGMDKVEVEKINVDFQNWVDNGVLPGTSVEAAPTSTAVVEMEG
jgi:paired amphipathic helix protein Sin3a